MGAQSSMARLLAVPGWTHVRVDPRPWAIRADGTQVERLHVAVDEQVVRHAVVPRRGPGVVGGVVRRRVGRGAPPAAVVEGAFDQVDVRGRVLDLRQRAAVVEPVHGVIDVVARIIVGAAGLDPPVGLGRTGQDLQVLHVGPEALPPVGADVGHVIEHERRRVVARVAREEFVVVLRVLHHAQADLLHVAQTARLLGLLARPGEDREQDGGEDRDDRDHD